jgi:hypothetical protein
MTTLHEHGTGKSKSGKDRRNHRRHDLELQEIGVERWDGDKREGETFGRIVDISAGGVRVRTAQPNVKTDHQIRVRLELPTYAGICPFVDTRGGQLEPRKDWVGWMTVARVSEVGNKQYDVAGQLVDMEEIDRGMLGLYLSTQPLAA